MQICVRYYVIILYYIILYFTHLCASVGKHLFIPSFNFSVKYIFYNYLFICNYSLSSFNHLFVYLFIYLLKQAYILVYLFNYIYLYTFIKYLSSQICLLILSFNVSATYSPSYLVYYLRQGHVRNTFLLGNLKEMSPLET
jgi:hypothetical protein